MLEFVPPQAERLELIKFTKPVERPSEFCRGRTAIVLEFSCPACETVQPRPPFATYGAATCPKCDLRMAVDGLFLAVWVEASEKVPA